MSDYYIRAEPIFSEESEEQYRKRICNIAAAERASEKRIWERKKLAEINKAKIELANISERMKTNDEKWDVPEHIRRWARCVSRSLESFNPELNTFNQPTVMKNETITIEAPEGHVIDKENSTDTVIRFKKVESNKRPMSFLDIKNIKGFYVDDMSILRSVDCVNKDSTKNTWPTRELAEAALALSQLLQLRDAWNEFKEEDYSKDIHWYVIGKGFERGSTNVWNTPRANFKGILCFKDSELADAFLKQFRPLIETALPLLY